MGDFTVQVSGNAAQGLAAASAEARKAIMGGVMEAANVVMREARLNAERNFTRQTAVMMPGTAGGLSLARSIITVRHDAQLAAEVGPTVIYGPIREFGGTIIPVHKKYLSWWTMEAPQGLHSDVKTHHTRFSYKAKKSVAANIGWAAHRVFAKRVVQQGKPYLHPALFQNATRILAAIDGAVAKWLNAAGLAA